MRCFFASTIVLCVCLCGSPLAGQTKKSATLATNDKADAKVAALLEAGAIQLSDDGAITFAPIRFPLRLQSCGLLTDKRILSRPRVHDVLGKTRCLVAIDYLDDSGAEQKMAYQICLIDKHPTAGQIDGQEFDPPLPPLEMTDTFQYLTKGGVKKTVPLLTPVDVDGLAVAAAKVAKQRKAAGEIHAKQESEAKARRESAMNEQRAAQEAKAKADAAAKAKLDAEKAAAKHVKDAAQLIDNAKWHYSGGRIDAAELRLRKLIREYGDTQYVDKAKALLKKWGKEVPK